MLVDSGLDFRFNHTQTDGGRNVSQPGPLLNKIWQAFSGEGAWQTVTDLSRFHRIQASPGFRQAVRYLQPRTNKN